MTETDINHNDRAVARMFTGTWCFISIIFKSFSRYFLTQFNIFLDRSYSALQVSIKLAEVDFNVGIFWLEYKVQNNMTE